MDNGEYIIGTGEPAEKELTRKERDANLAEMLIEKEETLPTIMPFLREDWLYVTPVKTVSSIIAVPKGMSVDHETAVYVVRAVGTETKDCKVGDEIVMCGINEGGKFKYKGATYFVVRESNVVCVMNR